MTAVTLESDFATRDINVGLDLTSFEDLYVNKESALFVKAIRRKNWFSETEGTADISEVVTCLVHGDQAAFCNSA